MSDLHQLERRSNRMDLVARWADDLAHEIKNPLHAMVINLELVKRRASSGEPESLIQRAEVVEAELHRVHDLVDSLLRLVRPWPGADLADVGQVFEQLLPVLGARMRVRRIDYEHEPGAGTVTMAPEDLALVLLNLVDNAIDVTPEGGRVATACQMGREAITIRVEDRGPGISDEVSEAPDRARPAPGRSGLGLPVTVRLLEAAGGRLAFEASPSGGTVAIVTVPRPASA